MKKKLTMINNIVCAVLLIATFASMLVPCWEYNTEEKYKVRYCNYCKTLAELDENNKVRDGYVCPGTVTLTKKEYEEKRAVKAEEPAPTEEATAPAEDAAEEVTAEPTETVVDATADATAPAGDTAVPEEEQDENEMVTVACAELKPKYKMEQRVNKIPAETSVMGYVWFAGDHKGLTEQFEEQGIVENDIVLSPFVLTLCGIVALLFCLLNMKGTWHSIFLLPAGILVVVDYLTKPEIFQFGQWTVTLALAAALSVASLLLFAQWVIKLVKWFVVPCHKK